MDEELAEMEIEIEHEWESGEFEVISRALNSF
jgi:hypothetical protein